MRAKIVACATLPRGFAAPPRATRCTVFAAIYAIVCTTASAEPVAINPDPPPPRQTVSVGRSQFRPSWDRDGVYLWLGPVGTASVVDSDWDSTFGGDLAIVRGRERHSLAAIGFDLGATTWTARGGGRIWLDALVGTMVSTRVVGLSLGPLVELHDLQHPRYGGSLGLWTYFGIAPFARVGVVDELGVFVDIGIHIALPVYRH